MTKHSSVSIKKQLVLSFIVISTIIIASVTYFNFTSNIAQEKENFIKSSLIQTKLFADFAAPTLAFWDNDGARENLENLKTDTNVLRAIIFDEKERIFTQYNPSNLRDIVAVNSKDIFHKKQVVSLVDNNDSFMSFGILKIAVPIKQKDKTYGVLYVERTTDSISNTIKKTFQEVIIFTMFLLIVIYLLSIIFSNYFLKPILSLANTAENIASSRDYATRVNYDSKNEIGSLYNAFNILLKDTENLTNNLEKEVDIKTNELNLKTQELESSLKNLKHTQQQLIESEKMSALGNLVSGIAHEVNTPLGNAITSSSIIQKETSSLFKSFEEGTLKRSTLDSKLNILNESSSLLVKTLNYASELIRSFKQISVDQATNDIRKFEIKEYIYEIFLTNHNKLKLIPVNISIYGDDDVKIKNSPGIIGQIFNNLIQNSITHGFDEFKGNARITVLLEVKNEDLIIEYSDNGKGIPQDLIGKVFEPFVTTKRNAGGTGLGLNIVYNLVTQKLQGKIQIQSQKDLGVKFIITIPLEYRRKEHI